MMVFKAAQDYNKKNLITAITAMLLVGVAYSDSASPKFLKEDQVQSCNEECMKYCVAYYPTSGCLETCNCEKTELGKVLYNLPSRKKRLTLAVVGPMD
jgi:hypothetical protein